MLSIITEPGQVWAVKDHRHSRGGGDDLAVLAHNEEDARYRLVAVIRQEHHKCQCSICVQARGGKFPVAAELVRMR